MSLNNKNEASVISSASNGVVIIPGDKNKFESDGGKSLMLNVEVVGESKMKVLSSTKWKIKEVYDVICTKIGLNSEGKKYFSLSQIVYDDDADIMSKWVNLNFKILNSNHHVRKCIFRSIFGF